MGAESKRQDQKRTKNVSWLKLQIKLLSPFCIVAQSRHNTVELHDSNMSLKPVAVNFIQNQQWKLFRFTKIYLIAVSSFFFLLIVIV